MDSVARGLTALSPSIGQAEDFISKKGIPPDQVPAFLASLGDPQLAGLIAQKQRLKQEQAKQVPPGGPQQSPPTVKDEINMQLAQLMQAKQQQQAQQQMGMPQGGMPPQQGQPGQPPMPPQGGPPPGGPPVQAAAGGLMGMGLGGLDAGAMEAPRHFDGGGVVAFTPGGSTVSTVRSKEEIEKEKAKTNQATNPYADVYNLANQQIEDLKSRTPYQRLEDPTVQEREDLYNSRIAEAKKEYEEDLKNSRRLADAESLQAAFSGKTLGQTVALNMKSSLEKKIAAKDKYSTLQDKLEDQLTNLHVANQATKESDNKSAWDFKKDTEEKIAGIRAEMAKTKVAESESDFEHKYKNSELAYRKQEVSRPTDQSNRALEYYNSLKAQKAAGDPSLQGKSDAELHAMAGEKAQTLAAGLRVDSSDRENYTSAIAKVEAGDAAARMRRLSSTPDDPRYIAAKKEYDQQIATINSVYPEQAKAVQSGQGGSGGSSGGVDTSNPLLR